MKRHLLKLPLSFLCLFVYLQPWRSLIVVHHHFFLLSLLRRNDKSAHKRPFCPVQRTQCWNYLVLSLLWYSKMGSYHVLPVFIYHWAVLVSSYCLHILIKKIDRRVLELKFSRDSLTGAVKLYRLGLIHLASYVKLASASLNTLHFWVLLVQMNLDMCLSLSLIFPV